MIKFDIDAIGKMKDLDVLNWEIIEARGIETGDTVALWEMALSMGESCAQCVYIARQMMAEIEFGVEPDHMMEHAIQTYTLLSAYFARDARSIVKFLTGRGFEFPPEHVGKRGPNDDGF